MTSGGVNAPRRPNGNIDWEQVYSKYVQSIIHRQKAPNTNRGVMYILESKGVLKKSDYPGLTNHLVQWRKSHRIPWGAIADGSGRGVFNDYRDYQTPSHYIDSRINQLKDAGNRYRKLLEGEWRWYGQPKYVEIWSEKHAVVGTVAAHIDGTFVRVAFNRGNPGWGYMKENCDRLRHELWYRDLDTRELRRRMVYVYYLGDNDKYGLDMDRQIREQLAHFGLLRQIKFERIAVLDEQVEEYDLPVNFEEGKGYEIDALNAFNEDAFSELLLDHIEPHFDDDIHAKLMELNTVKQISKVVRQKVKFVPQPKQKRRRRLH